MRKTSLARKTIDRSKMYGEKEEAFCELVTQGIDPELAWRQASGTKASDEIVKAAVKRLMNRGDIRLAIELKRKARAEEVEERQKQREEEPHTPLLPELNESEDIEWSQSIAFNRLKRLLDGCDSATKLLEDRPQLFRDVYDMISDVKVKLAENRVTVNNTEGVRDLMKVLESIESIVSKVSKFSIKEYNSTILTASNLMKEMNAITGVKKNAGALKNENFEDRLMRLLEETASQTATQSPYSSNNILYSNNNNIENGGQDGQQALMSAMEDYAYGDDDEG